MGTVHRYFILMSVSIELIFFSFLLFSFFYLYAEYLSLDIVIRWCLPLLFTSLAFPHSSPNLFIFFSSLSKIIVRFPFRLLLQEKKGKSSDLSINSEETELQAKLQIQPKQNKPKHQTQINPHNLLSSTSPPLSIPDLFVIPPSFPQPKSPP